MQVLDAGAEAPTGCPVSLVDESTSVYMQLGEGDVDHGKELDKHLKEQVTQLRLGMKLGFCTAQTALKDPRRLFALVGAAAQGPCGSQVYSTPSLDVQQFIA